MTRRLLLVPFTLLAPHLGASDIVAQATPPSARDAFLEGAAEAAVKYSDRREAIADGFRRLGPDFPGMGAHWVQTGRIVSGVLEGGRPAVLCYAELNGEPTLVALAYTLPLSPDESPPEEPLGAHAWHDHSGEVTEESFLLNHPSSLMASDAGFRLSMVHVWLPLSNPSGILEQNNWRLPFLRAGIEPPELPTSLAARGLSLGGGGIGYYRELLYWASPESAADRAAIDRALERSAASVGAWIERRRGDPDAATLEDLEGIWQAFWQELEGSLSTDVYQRIHPLRNGH